MAGEITRVTLRVTGLLEQLGVRYAVGGSLASSLHGVMRSTLDVDIVADLRPEHVAPLVDALADEFYADEAMMRDAVERQRSFNLIHYATAFKVDVFVRRPRGFDRQQLDRREAVLISAEPEGRIYVLSAEDIVLAKLNWYRQGGGVSERQWRDVLGVLKTRAGGLDLSYLRRWADALRVGDLLERALSEADLTEQA